MHWGKTREISKETKERLAILPNPSNICIVPTFKKTRPSLTYSSIMFTSADVLCCLQSDNCAAFSEHPPEPDKETQATVSRCHSLLKEGEDMRIWASLFCLGPGRCSSLLLFTTLIIPAVSSPGIRIWQILHCDLPSLLLVGTTLNVNCGDTL